MAIHLSSGEGNRVEHLSTTSHIELKEGGRKEGIDTRRKSALPQKLCKSIPLAKGMFTIVHLSKSM